ncbi:MAG TPA: peptidoglycan-associated lipoprotein Pal [Bdellovibrionales bacterium]|nr:peptidoglycan-associated lipoprotein Pal [Bdellovibrionales bacterium]
MLKRFSLLTLMFAALMLTVSCASKKKADTPAGGADGGTMGANITSQEMSFDASGSDSGKIPGLSSVAFDYDSSNLSSDSRRRLAENAEWIKTNANSTVQVEGHCDSRGSVEYNLALGERRAKAVKNYLVSLGVDSKRLTIISYGEEKPIAMGESEEAYAKNRRANFVPLSQ